MRELLLVALLGISFGAIWAISVGKDVGWDQRNYQYYNVYAWFADQVSYHIVPAQLQSWLNPLLYVPHYVLINHTPPVVAGSVLGALTGLNFALVYALARLVVPMGNRVLAAVLGVLCGVIGFSDWLLLEQVGAVASDSLVSLPVLGGLFALCWSHRRPTAPPSQQNLGYWLGGLLMGAACGLKLTCAVYASGLTLSLLILQPVLQFGLRRFALYAAGGGIGFLLTGGYWSTFLWNLYRNPVFPYWNNVFQSPWALQENYRDARFLPATVGDALSYPFQWLVGLHPTSELPFHEARFAVIAVVFPVTFLALTVRFLLFRVSRSGSQGAMRAPVSREHFWLLSVYFICSWWIWVFMFGIQRYLIPLALISGLTVFLLLDRLLPSRSFRLTVFAGFALFCVLWNKPRLSDRLPYGSDWFGVELAPVALVPDTLFVMLGDVPISYVIPFLPDSARVIRLTGNMSLDPDTPFGKQAQELITHHSGPLRTLTASSLAEWEHDQLRLFGLSINPEGCETFRSQVDVFTTCPLIRETGG